MISINFTHQQILYQVYLQKIESHLENAISIEGVHYQIVGRPEEVNLLNHHIHNFKKNDFSTFHSFEVLLASYEFSQKNPFCLSTGIN